MTDRPTASTINDAQLDQLHDDLEHARARLGAALACIRLLKIYAHVLDGQDGASDVARRIRSILAGLDDEPTDGDDQPHIYLSTGCYHDDHAYCQAMTGLNGAKRPASCKKCEAKCICSCHQQTEPHAHTGGNAEGCPVCRPEIDKTVLYPWVCAGAEAAADDLTGVWTPDPPIGCLTVTAEPTPSQRPELRDQLADATVPLLLDTLPKAIARARAYEVADAALTVLYCEWPWLRAEAEDLLDRTVQTRHGGDRSKLDNIQLAGYPSGTSKEAGLRRLRKDRPDLHAEVLAGTLSTHAAMLKAGFRRRKISIPVSTPADAAKALRRNLEPEQIKELVKLLADD